MLLTVKSSFDSAHLLIGYQGKCSNIHGHTWNVEVAFGSTTGDLDDVGIMFDFSVLKDLLKSVTDEFDHCLLVNMEHEEGKWLLDTLGHKYKVVGLSCNPTAENLVQIIRAKLVERIKESSLPITIKRVVLWETPNNSCELEW